MVETGIDVAVSAAVVMVAASAKVDVPAGANPTELEALPLLLIGSTTVPGASAPPLPLVPPVPPLAPPINVPAVPPATPPP